MFVLDLDYSYYKCQACLNNSNKLFDLYHNIDFGKHVLVPDYMDDELEAFLLELLKRIGQGLSSDQIDTFVSAYVRLTDLILYMRNINHAMKQHKKMLNDTYLNYPLVHDCFLPDSRLVNIQFNSNTHTCTMNFAHVTLYNSMRKNKNLQVDSGAIGFQFIKVQKVRMKGELYLEHYAANKIYSSHIMKNQDNTIDFCLFLLVDNQSCMIEVTCSDINVSFIDIPDLKDTASRMSE